MRQAEARILYWLLGAAIVTIAIQAVVISSESGLASGLRAQVLELQDEAYAAESRARDAEASLRGLTRPPTP